MMQIVPVLDIQGGQVVRAVGGRRSEYRPLVSKLTNSTDPLEVASSFRARYQLSEIYVADLDAIQGAPPAISTYDRLCENGFRIWVDAGVREAKDAEAISDNCDAVVIGLETVGGPETFAEIGSLLLPSPPASGGEGLGVRGERAAKNPHPHPLSRKAGRGENDLVFSLDLRDGRPLCDPAWKTEDPISITERVVAAGVRRIIVLDLARVGSRSGIGTEDPLQSLIRRFAHVEFYVGGGVRNRNDVSRLESLGVAGVLMASALHDELL